MTTRLLARTRALRGENAAMHRYQSAGITKMTRRHVPLLNQWVLRSALGLICAAGSPFLVALALERESAGYPLPIAMVGSGWLSAVLLTDKYVQKYPQRYWLTR